MTAKPDKLRLFYPSRDLSANDQPLPDRTVTGGSLNTLLTDSLTQDTGYWDGAIGFFTDTSNPVLRGKFFHVQSWTAETNTLLLTQPLPAIPVSTDVFRLCKGGKYLSSQEIPGLKVSGKQPEFDLVTGTNITGITITKASPMLGDGTLTLNYTAAVKTLQIKMGNDDYGIAVSLTANGKVILYDVYENGWIEISAVYASLPTANKTDTFTLQIPQGIFIPNVEAYDAADPAGRFRYYLVGAKNTSDNGNDTMSGFGVWTEQPTTTTAVIQSGQPNTNSAATIVLTAAPTDWPVKGFWIHNKTKGDYRFILNRVGNKLTTKTVQNMICHFTQTNQSADTDPFIIGQEYYCNYNTANYSIGKLLNITMTSGSFANKNASGRLVFQTYYNVNSGYLMKTSGGTSLANLSNISYCTRNTATVSWAVNDILEVVSELDIAQDINGVTLFDPIGEYTSPAVNLQFVPAATLDDRLMADSLEIGGQKAFWVRQEILPNVPAHEAVLGSLNFSWY